MDRTWAVVALVPRSLFGAMSGTRKLNLAQPILTSPSSLYLVVLELLLGEESGFEENL